LYPLVHCLPRFANGNPNESERLPLWHEEDDYDDQPVSAPATELGRNQSPDSREKYSPKKPRDSLDPEMALPQVDAERPLRPARNPPPTSMLDIFPFLRFFKYISHKIFRTGSAGKYKKKRPFIEYVESNIPLEIILVLSK
jgi:putative membrane protein